MNAYVLEHDAQLGRPVWAPPFVRAGRIVLPLVVLDRDVVAAVLLLGTIGASGVRLVHVGRGHGELELRPDGPLVGHHALSLRLRYSDGIQHVDDRVDTNVQAPAGALRIEFTEHGTVRVELPVPLAVTPLLTTPSAYRIEVTEPGRAPLEIRTVGREERRPDAAGTLRPISDPRYLELFVSGAPGRYRLHLPALATIDGGVFGPASGTFVARLVKRGFAERTLGARRAHAHELAPGVVLSALFAEDERAGGRGGNG